MDDEEFKRRLSEVAEWRIPETITGTKDGDAKKRRGRKSSEELYQEAREEIFLEEFGGVNHTFPPQILKVKKESCVCNDCGKFCESGRQKEKKLYETGTAKKRNWRERCVTCGLHQNPFTGKFELQPQAASHVWTDFLRERKGEYKSKFARAQELLKDQEEIRINPENPHKI